MSIKICSRKGKARRLQNKVKEILLERYGNLQEGDVKPAIMGESGRDINLSPLAESQIPFDIECKNQEALNVWAALGQAENNTSNDRVPLLVFKRNRSKIYCALEFDKLLDILNRD